MKRMTLVAGLALVAAMPAFAQDAAAQPAEEPKDKLTIERRLAIIEEALAAEPYVAKEDMPESTLGFLGQAEISGLASASYFYNFNDPDSRLNTGRGFDSRHNQFVPNKLMLKIEKPVESDAFAWQGGFCTELILGKDAEYTQASGLDLGTDGDLLLAYAEFNVPVGNGLKVQVGKYPTCLGYELFETEQNGNWSGGNQWALLEPGTHAGISLLYPLGVEWEAQLCVNQGWDVIDDNNEALSYMGRVAWTPREELSYSLVGFYGPEQDDNLANARSGLDFIASYDWSSIWSTQCQLDYGNEVGAAMVAMTDEETGETTFENEGDAKWYGAGLWQTYQPSEKMSFVLRADYVNDVNGARTSEAPAPAPFAANDGQELVSVTMTANFMPVEGLKLAPEVRWDRSSLETAFEGEQTQVTAGFGTVYEF